MSFTYPQESDVFPSRIAAIEVAKALRKRGWQARVEASGPAHDKEMRVVVFHPEWRRPNGERVVAYFHAGDTVGNFNPTWV